MIFLNPTVRRIVYVSLFEIIAIISSTLLLMILSGGSAKESLPLAISVSVIAVVWNYIFNTLFELWERSRQKVSRSFRIRITHAVLFEAGLLLITVPLYMWWYSIGPWRAITMEAIILIFFLVYTFVFTWVFDLIFALPGNRK